MKTRRFWMRAALLGMGLLWSAGALAQSRTAVVLSTASINGETISCGCQKKELGGIARRAAFIKAQRAKAPATILVDAGDFGSAVKIEPWMRTEFQMDMMAKLAYDALTPGPNEMVMGLDKLVALYARAPGIKVVSANIVNKKTQQPIWADFAIVERGGVKFGITGVTDRAFYDFNASRGMVKSDDFDFKDPKESLRRVLPQLRQQADVVVVLVHTGSDDAKRMLDGLTGIDVAIVGHIPVYKFLPEVADNTLLVQTGNRGQYMGHVEFTLDGNKIVAHEGETQALGDTVPVDPEFNTLVQAFNKKYDALDPMSKVKTPEKTEPTDQTQ
jgi:5'-nucleotidase / UDP-sugar diphosphatase